MRCDSLSWARILRPRWPEMAGGGLLDERPALHIPQAVMDGECSDGSFFVSFCGFSVVFNSSLPGLYPFYLPSYQCKTFKLSLHFMQKRGHWQWLWSICVNLWLPVWMNWWFIWQCLWSSKIINTWISMMCILGIFLWEIPKEMFRQWKTEKLHAIKSNQIHQMLYWIYVLQHPQVKVQSKLGRMIWYPELMTFLLPEYERVSRIPSDNRQWPGRFWA